MAIQSILRHSDVKTTLAYYVRTREEKAREAMKKLDEALGTDLSL
jgi:integrase